MKNKIMYNGTTYEDNLKITMRLRATFWMRICFLFCSKAEVEQDVYCKTIMPEHEAAPGVFRIYSIWDWLKDKFQKRRGFVENFKTLYIFHTVSEMDHTMIQKCTRCGEIICDYSNASWPSDQSPPKGFPAGGLWVSNSNPKIFTRILGSGERHKPCSPK